MGTLINKLPTDDMIVNKCCDHQCSCCGSCCAEFLPLTRKEVFKIIDYLAEHKEIKCSHSIDKDKKNVYGFCPFLNEHTNRCNIYPIRPFVCRNFKCDKDIKTLKAERIEYAKRADYNAFDDKKPIVSLHFLFFGEIKYDLIYRHNVLEIISKEQRSNRTLSIKEEMAIMPLFVDKFLKIDENEKEDFKK